MSILFDDARVTTRARGRSTTGLWLSIGVHAVAGVVIAFTIAAPKEPPAPRVRPRIVFIAPVTLPPVPVVAPRLPDPPPPVRELARAEAPKPLPVAPIVTKPVEAAPAPPVPAPAPDRPIEKPEIQRPV